ncbi:MAG: phosphoserine phosphatase RsbU/P, partial [Patescibacteria group bacterium]|nr:phosphoserine phosphatase RsbU/P [Patescibacteria group bacterium]
MVFFTFDAFVLGTLFAPDLIPENEYSILVVENTELLIPIFAIQTFAYAILVWVLLISPIRKLRKQVAYFIAGVRSTGLPPPSGYPDLTYIIGFFNRSFEILWNFKEEFKAGRVLRSEVELAADIQRHVLKKTDVRAGSLDIVANTKSATEVGGDSYDIIERGNNRYIYLGDVTGHGVASGFVMMVVNALISGFSKMAISGAEILANTNEILKPRVKSNMLMTCLMIRWNEEEKKLYMSGAGHEYLIIYKKSRNAVFKLKTGGIALGMTRDISKAIKESQLSFDPGDVIVMYTDGITEARSG